jgi:hypothetical protein
MRTLIILLLLNTTIQVDPQRLYRGDPADFRKAACVSADQIYDAIPAYQEIVDRGLTKDQPQYWILISKANQDFHDALVQAEKQLGYDLIGERGTIRIDANPPTDITAQLIKLLR